jgi:type II secretory pathway component PulF
MGEPATQNGRYSFVVRKRTGERQRGVLTGASRDEVLARLHSEGKVVLELVEGSGGAGRWARPAAWGGFSFSRRRVGVRELALFTRQLATVLGAGIPIVRGLRGLAADVSQRTLSTAVEDVALRIEKGETLSGAFGAHPEAFNGFYVSMMRAGENAGVLDSVLEALATMRVRLQRASGIGRQAKWAK